MATPRVAAIVLAAGAATRFGAPKQLARFLGEPLVARAVRHAAEIGASPIVVVLGAHAPAISDALTGHAHVITVTNGEWQTGIASSLRAGIGAVPVDVIDCVLFTTVDQPLVDGPMLMRLVDAYSAQHTIVCAEYDGVIGVPALVGKEHVAELACYLVGDTGAGAWLRAHPDLVTRVPLEVAAFDVDTVGALRVAEQLSIEIGAIGHSHGST